MRVLYRIHNVLQFLNSTLILGSTTAKVVQNTNNITGPGAGDWLTAWLHCTRFAWRCTEHSNKHTDSQVFPSTTLCSVCHCSTSTSRGLCYTSRTVCLFCHCLSVSLCLLCKLTYLTKILVIKINTGHFNCGSKQIPAGDARTYSIYFCCEPYNFTNKRQASHLILCKYRGVTNKQPSTLLHLEQVKVKVVGWEGGGGSYEY